jgi:hypothetical protein
MNEELIKELIKTKLTIVDSLIHILPPVIQERAAGFRQSMFGVIREVLNEYDTNNTQSQKREKGLRSIEIG